MTTALLTHPDGFDHATPPGHPEQVARLDAVLGALEGMNLMRVKAPLAAEADAKAFDRHYNVSLNVGSKSGEGLSSAERTFANAGMRGAYRRRRK